MAGGALCVSAHVARRGKGSVVGERAWKKAGKRCVAMGAAAAPSRGVGTGEKEKEEEEEEEEEGKEEVGVIISFL